MLMQKNIDEMQNTEVANRLNNQQTDSDDDTNKNSIKQRYFKAKTKKAKTNNSYFATDVD